MLEILESISGIIIVLGVVFTGIVGIANPREDSFLWKIVQLLNYMSLCNPRGVKVIRWSEYKRMTEHAEKNNIDDSIN